MMAKLLVYLDEDLHADLKELAHQKKASMAALVRYALDKTFEDELDNISSARALDEMLAHPEESITLDEYIARRGLALPSKPVTKSAPRPRKVAERRGAYGSREDR
jgi:hypothetical protein